MVGGLRRAVLLIAVATCVGPSAANELDLLLSGGRQREFAIAMDSESVTYRLRDRAHECLVSQDQLHKHFVGVHVSFNPVTRAGTVAVWSYREFGKAIDFLTLILPGSRGTALVKTSIPKDHSYRRLTDVERWIKNPDSFCLQSTIGAIDRRRDDGESPAAAS